MQKADCSNSPDEKEVKPSLSPTSEREAAERWLRWSQCDLTAGLEHSMVDHKDGDGLNNRRHNLRGCTRRDNSANSRKRQHTSSRFKGVSYNSGKWLATIGYDRKTHYLGRYDTEEDAAMAYDRAALRHFGTFAKVNFK